LYNCPSLEQKTLDESVYSFDESQCGRVGQNFAIRANLLALGEILAEKKLVGRLFGRFLWLLGDFFTKTSGHPGFG
jgi:hypothetical protein